MNTNLTTRRALLRGMVLASGAAVLAARSGRSAQAAATVEIWRSPACGCCHGWIEHLQAAGFAVSGNWSRGAASGRSDPLAMTV